MGGLRRRVLCLSIAIVIAITLAALAGCSEPEPSAPERPDTPVVLIVVDTLRADHLQTWGHARETSPHLAAWAERGRVFTNALATSPWTLPSVASILTGALPSRHRAGFVPSVNGRKPGLVTDIDAIEPLAANVITLAESLRDAGYATGAVVTNSFLDEKFGVSRGFEHYDYRAAWVGRSRRADAAVDAALEWVDARRGAPFFLMLHLFDPHLAYDAPPPMRGRFTGEYEGGRYSLPFKGDRGLSVGSVALEPRDRDFVRAAYDEEIAWVDRELERLRAGLERRRLLDRALIVLTSDHGEELFEHGGFEHGHAMFQELLHVPLIVWGPQVEPGREPAWVSLVDIAPTLREALGLERRADDPARSLWANVTRATPLQNVPLYAEFNIYGPRQRAMLHWPDKLAQIDRLELTLLYDLSSDPGEQASLAEDMPEKANSLRRHLDAVLSTAAERAPRGSPAASSLGLDAEAQESLRSLGYIEGDDEGDPEPGDPVAAPEAPPSAAP